jgi:parallel beta-helix repeat protein
MRRRLTVCVFAVLVCTAVFGVSPAMAATLRVDDDGADCPAANFTTVQAAVDAAVANDRVLVCDGTYPEQVVIEGEAKNGVQLEGRTPLGAAIEFPATTTPPNALVRVTNADDVQVLNLVLRGPYPATGCTAPENNHSGLFVDDSFGLLAQDNRITRIRADNPALFGCQDGFAVLVGDSAEAVASNGSAFLLDNSITEYQKGGVVVDNTESGAFVIGSTIRPADQVRDALAPNGVQVSNGAGAAIAGNNISENSFFGDPNGGTGSGIILFEPGRGEVTATNNTVVDNDDGIVSLGTRRAQIENNTIRRSRVFDGLFFAADSINNEIRGNVATSNSEHDCHDETEGGRTAGTQNTWVDNRGRTENRPGLCRGARVVAPEFEPTPTP